MSPEVPLDQSHARLTSAFPTGSRPILTNVINGLCTTTMSQSESSGSSLEESWIEWFCSVQGHGFFCEVDRSYIEDSFNLYGLRAIIPNYQHSLDIILDNTPTEHDGGHRRGTSGGQRAGDASSSSLMGSSSSGHKNTFPNELYGLIHSRFILTTRGLESMARKFQNEDFGVCPRVLCKGQAVLPAGISSELKKGGMKIFCPKCQDLYAASMEMEENESTFEPVCI